MAFPELMEKGMKFTARDTTGLQLPAGKNDFIAFDDDNPGLGLRLRAGGSRVWIYQYELGAKKRRMTLGSAKTITLGDVRKLAGTLHAKVRLGYDPASEKTERRGRAIETFGAVSERYLAHKKLERREGTYAEIARHIQKHSKPLHEFQLASISRAMIAERLNAIATENGLVTANRVRSSLSAFFGWAIREGITELNPVIATNKNKETERSRVLSDDELQLVWNASGADHYGAIIKLLMLTAQRADEIASLRRSELGDAAIRLPSSRTKNGREHLVPLSDPALEIVEAQPTRTNPDGTARDLLFGLGRKGFSGWSGAKEKLDDRIKAAAGQEIEPWTVHDLRRTGATGMARLGVQPHIIEAVLNHASGHKSGVAGIYNRATYEPEKRAALVLWADHVMSVVDGRASNIAILRTA